MSVADTNDAGMYRKMAPTKEWFAPSRESCKMDAIMMNAMAATNPPIAPPMSAKTQSANPASNRRQTGA